MLGAGLRVCFAWLAKLLTLLLERHFVDLAIILDYVHSLALPIDKGGDLLGALVPAHLGTLVLEGLHKDYDLSLGHGESIGKCLVIEWLAPCLIDC